MEQTDALMEQDNKKRSGIQKNSEHFSVPIT